MLRYDTVIYALFGDVAEVVFSFRTYKKQKELERSLFSGYFKLQQLREVMWKRNETGVKLQSYGGSRVPSGRADLDGRDLHSNREHTM